MKSPKAKASDLCTYGFGFGFPIERKSSAFRPLRGRVHFFDKRQRNETKENALCPEQTRAVVVAGIFREGILPSRKTPHIHVRRPPGLRATPVIPHPQEQKNRRTEEQKNSQAGRSNNSTSATASPVPSTRNSPASST